MASRRKPRNATNPEFRMDPVSLEWVLLAPRRAVRPHAFTKKRHEAPAPISTCPFEDPQKSNNVSPVIWFPPPGTRSRAADLKDWFVQVIPNKYPMLTRHYASCSVLIHEGSAAHMEAVGFHEVIISRPHNRSLARMRSNEVELIIRAYQERMRALGKEPCVEYVLVFHNHGKDAGASLFHPHSQLIALPVIPPDIARSLDGSTSYFRAHHRCVHCDVIRSERKARTRIIYTNKEFVLLAPYASHVPYEMRIYPLRHASRFEELTARGHIELADVLRHALRALARGLDDVSYNFFIHTAPFGRERYEHYHWHLEIFPRVNEWGGVELGTGVEVVSVTPEDAAALLKKYI